MFAALERHMLHLLKFKVNIPTALDFTLFFAHSAFSRDEAQHLVQKCLPWIYFVAVNHDINRYKKPSSIALAALCHSIQSSRSLHQVYRRDRLLRMLIHKEESINQSFELLQIFHSEVGLVQLQLDDGEQDLQSNQMMSAGEECKVDRVKGDQSEL